MAIARCSFFTRLSAAACACIALIVPVEVLRAAPLAELAALDALIARHDSPLALERFRQLKAPPDAVLPWLRQKAEAGHPPFQNELAIRLLDTDLTESLKWYARGHLARILDAAECDLPGVSMFPDPGLERVRLAGVANPELMLKASEDALAWADSGDSSQPSTWICRRGEWHERAAKRREARREMQFATLRLRRYVESIKEGKEFAAKFHDAAALVSGASRRTAWMDNERLLYISTERSGSMNGELPDIGLFLWNVGKEPPRRLFALQLRRPVDVCVRDGTLYVVDSNQETKGYDVWKGTVAAIRRVRPSTPTFDAYEHFRECEQRWLHMVVDGWVIQPLRYGDGYLVSKPNARSVELVASHGKKFDLPIRSFAAGLLDEAPWSGAYLVGGPGVSTNAVQVKSRYFDGRDVELFSVWADGRTQMHLIPNGFWDTMEYHSTGYRLTRLGVLTSGGFSDEGSVDGWNGLFLFPFHRKPTVRLLPGRHDIHGISPNGCRVALSPDVDARYRPRRLVRVIDIC